MRSDVVEQATAISVEIVLRVVYLYSQRSNLLTYANLLLHFRVLLAGHRLYLVASLAKLASRGYFVHFSVFFLFMLQLCVIVTSASAYKVNLENKMCGV